MKSRNQNLFNCKVKLLLTDYKFQFKCLQHVFLNLIWRLLKVGECTHNTCSNVGR